MNNTMHPVGDKCTGSFPAIFMYYNLRREAQNSNLVPQKKKKKIKFLKKEAGNATFP